MEQQQAVVMKFGGTSVQDAAAVRRLVEIVAREHRPCVVVVSALAGVTDALCAIADACDSAADVQGRVDGLAARHRALIHEVVAPARQPHTAKRADDLLRSGSAVVAAVGGRRCSIADRDRLVAAGELASSLIVAEALCASGLPALWLDAREIVITDNTFGMARPDALAIRDAVRRSLAPLLARDGIPVLGGFIGATPHGVTTTLGRGGSDYSAALIAAAADAGELQIWTDVDGVFTADPQIVSSAVPIARLSFEEAYELARFGAKVLHCGTLEPVAARRIPVRVVEARRPGRPGTVISSAHNACSPRVAGLALQRVVTLADVRARSVSGSHCFFSSANRWLNGEGHGNTVIALSPSRAVVASLDAARIDRFLGALDDVGDVHRLQNVSLTTVVGQNVSAHPAAWRVLSSAAQEGRLLSFVPAHSGHALVAIADAREGAALLTHLHDELVSKVSSGERGLRVAGGRA